MQWIRHIVNKRIMKMKARIKIQKDPVFTYKADDFLSVYL